MNLTKIERPTSVSDAFQELLDKMYISNVQNRLRQLNEPSYNDSRRWVWELIQNAKDSISKDDSRDTVDIRLSVNGNLVRFSHNGSPFTAKAQLGLLYKYSEGKDNNSESTGRFGTGFLTTHTLSKVVSIEGDILTDNANEPICGFTATMYRDGLDDEELLEGVKKMKESMVYTKELNHWTTYTYHLKTPQNEEALKLGLENFLSNITQTMLFCKELNTVELDENGNKTKITRTLQNQPLENNVYLSEFEISSERITKKRYIHTSLSKYSEDLTQRFKTNRDIRLDAAIEVDIENNLIENNDSPSHFCVLPLVGSEKHIMPVYLNSPDFEPDSERESLILIGDKMLSDKGVISEGGINRLILAESIELFETLVHYLSRSANYKNLYLLAKGLKRVPSFEKNFNRDWFKSVIIMNFREVLSKLPVFETNSGNYNLFTENSRPFPVIPKDTKTQNQSVLFDLAESLFPERLPKKNIAAKWAELAWDGCGLFQVEDLCKEVEKASNLENLVLFTKREEWINNFLGFISDYDSKLLSDYAIIPNRNLDFVKISTPNFAQTENVDDFTIELLKKLGEDLSPILLNSCIYAIKVPLKIDQKYIAEKIDEQVKAIINEGQGLKTSLKRLEPLVQIIPTDFAKYDDAFINLQTDTFNFTRDLNEEIIAFEHHNNSIEPRAWRSLHKWLIIELMKTVADYKSIERLPARIENAYMWLNQFISYASNQIKDGTLDEIPIIPNQNGTFCLKQDLSRDTGVPNVLKSEEAESYGILLKQDLLHPEINSVFPSSEKNLQSVINLIDELIAEKVSVSKGETLDLALYLCHFIPSSIDTISHKLQSTFLSLTRKFFHERCALLEKNELDTSSEDFWRKSNQIVIKSLTEQISQLESLEKLKVHLSTPETPFDIGDTEIFLSDLYDLHSDTNRKISDPIIPNQNGYFKSLEDDIYRDEGIPNKLKDILATISPENDFRDILANSSLSDSGQPSHSKNIDDIILVLDSLVNDLYKDPANWEKPKFKEAIEDLMIEWFPSNPELAKKFEKIHKKKETIEMNVLWSLEERKRMQRARSVDPDLLDKFIESNGDLDSLNEQKTKLKEELEELKEETKEVKIIKEILEEFPDLTIEEVKRLKDIERRIKECLILPNFRTTS